jgi:RNA polymerase sigma-70 factor (ECF subfamily)
MKLRTRRRKADVSFDELAAYDAERILETRAGGGWGLQDQPCDAALARGQIAQRLRACLARLPERYRDVLVLRDLEQLDTHEAARRLGVSATAVKLRLHRARRALRRLLELRSNEF